MLYRASAVRQSPIFLGNALKIVAAAMNTSQTRFSSTDTEVTIGNVSKSYSKPKTPQFVPHNYLPEKKSQTALQHLRWMLQKDLLGQDMFLIGRPGPERRRLAMEFLELTGREVEFVSLSRDTTEADLKQRRELRNGTAEFFDQSAVRAALEGRVLILEGVEKAERNVLPVLNNLLENREMHLEDGRFLVPASRYDKLLKENSREELDRWRLVRVSEDFRVIALGVPVPRYPGNPLDPPLRSRFQARFVGPETFKDVLAELQNSHPNADPTDLSVLVSGCMALLSPEATSMSLPDCAVSNLHSAAKLLGSFKGLPVHSTLSRIYPYQLLIPPENMAPVENMLTSLGIAKPKASHSVHVKQVTTDGSEQAQCTVSLDGNSSNVNVPCGSGIGGSPSPPFVETAYQKTFLGELVQSHSAGDICIVGPRGCGKSATLLQLASKLNYVQEPIVLYQDMTSRDLIQQRTTKPNGDTVWNNSPLVTAALEGNLAILDGLHRIHPSTFSVIARLVQDREIQLYDGKRLVRHDRYDSLKSELGLSDAQLNSSGVFRIHPSFRIVALSEKSKAAGDSVKSSWITSEMLSLFLFHEMRPLSSSEELKIIEELYGRPSKAMQSVVTLANRLRGSEDATLRSISNSLSTRQLLRIARRMAAFPSNDVYNTVQRACLSRFLPTVPRRALTKMLSDLDIEPTESVDSAKNLTCAIVGDKVHIGNTIAARYPDTAAKTKVPDILFYDVPQHIQVLEGLVQDFVLGEHLLLVGNQGVGKNKLADRLLQLLNRPREYIQLHRDTTVQTLTLQPSVRDGVVVFDDSPLVKAIKLGHVLMVDEADKAPTHVTCILKTLVESGEMILSDGRRIVQHNDKRAANPSENIIPIHPDFRMIIMANRPGFPFLGNDFFGALGDLFSCHDIDNPSPESELALLKSYGPDVPDALVQKLVRAFGELRSMADQGLVTYPYSTREVVHIVRHLQKFPEEPLTSVVSNVFDFDRESSEAISTVVEILHKHGIPVGAKPDKIALAPELPLPPVVQLGKWEQFASGSSDLMVSERQLNLRPAVDVKRNNVPLDHVQLRSLAFTEMQSYCLIPLDEMGVVTSLALSKGEAANLNSDNIYVSISNPQSVISLKPEAASGTEFQLRQVFGSDCDFHKLKMLPLGEHLQGCLLIHEGKTNSLVILDTEGAQASRISTGSFFETATEKFTRSFSRYAKPLWSITPLESPNKVVLYENGTGHIAMIDLNARTTHNTHVPINLQNLHPISANLWLLGDNDKKFWTLTKTSTSDPFPSVLTPLKSNFPVSSFGNIEEALRESLPSEMIERALGKVTEGPNRLFSTNETLASVALNFPDESGDGSMIYTWPRKTVKPPIGSPLILKQNGQVVTFCDAATVPIDGLPKGNNDEGHKPLLGYLEVVDVLNHNVRYIPVPETQLSRLTAADYFGHVGTPLLLAETSSGLVTVDKKGCLRMWETGYLQLARSLDEWQKLVGQDGSPLQATVKRDSGASTQGPKHGKVDSLNEPHVGGNTWAGGTGGRDTAGLGGKGGPYRLDAGHTVHQLSDEEKDAVPDHIKKAAREMGQRAFSQRLREIQMSSYDANLYDQFYSSVSKQIQTLRVMLSNLQAKSKERQWIKHQTSGELDDTKLIEGLAGEKTIYKRRADLDPELGAPQTKPKRVRLVVDVSGSMYRFNSYDKRLDREMEAVVLVMEAFQGFEERIKYDIQGHSGDGYGINFVNLTKQPTNNKERLDVIKTMHAHAQFCMAGDHTLDATSAAVSALAEEDCDEAIVVVLSDANFERYRIPPRRFAKALTDNAKVNAYAIFIGSLGDQAERLKRQLPAGRAFICMDLKDIPQILQQIFAASMLNS